jgi:hypothetical protein
VACELRPDLALSSILEGDNSYRYFDPTTSSVDDGGDDGFPPPSLYDAVLGHESNPIVHSSQLSRQTREAIESATGFDLDECRQMTLSDLNDNKAPFELIATIIDEAL